MNPRILPLGDTAVIIELGDHIDLAVNRQVHALDTHLRAHQLAGVIELVPAYASLTVHYDPLRLTLAEVSDWIHVEMPKASAVGRSEQRRIEVPVRYGGEGGPDLAAVAAVHNMSPGAVASIHAGRDYTVYMMGFTPGFPYMGLLDEAIATPRLETPRTRVRAGSVGIAGRQTGIYPIESPGGWRIIGQTSLPLFDLDSMEPFLFAPGDAVRFLVEALDV